MTYQLVGGGSLPGWITVAGDTFTFSSTDNSEAGTYNIEVTMTDDNSVTDPAGVMADTQSFVLTITEYNVAPVLTTTDLSCYAWATCTSAVSYTDFNAGDSHTVTYTVSGGSGNGATWTSEATDTFSFVPTDNGEVGVYTISVTVTDDDSTSTGATLSDTQTITLTVLEVNIAPDVTVADQACDSYQTCTYTPPVTDSNAGDSHTMTYQLVGGGALPGFITVSNHEFTFQSTDNSENGVYNIEVTMTDDNSAADAVNGVLAETESFVLTISWGDPTNLAPILVVSDVSCQVESTCTHAFTYSDADAGDTLTMTWTISGGSGNGATWTSEAADTFTISPPINADVGVYTITVTVTDDNSISSSSGVLSDTEVITLTVLALNHSPTLATAAQTCTAYSTCTYTPTITDSDSGDSHSIAGTIATAALPAWITVSGGTFTFSPADNSVVNTYTIDSVISDDNSEGDAAGVLSASSTFVLTILPYNNVPTLTTPADVSCNLGDLTCSSAFTFADTEVGDSHTYTVTYGDGSALDGFIVEAA
jgi:hypothetical protein